MSTATITDPAENIGKMGSNPEEDLSNTHSKARNMLKEGVDVDGGDIMGSGALAHFHKRGDPGMTDGKIEFVVHCHCKRAADIGVRVLGSRGPVAWSDAPDGGFDYD